MKGGGLGLLLLFFALLAIFHLSFCVSFFSSFSWFYLFLLPLFLLFPFLFCSPFFYSTLLASLLLYSRLYSLLSTPLYPTLLYPTLSTLLCSPLHSTLLYSPCSKLLYFSNLIYSARLHSSLPLLPLLAFPDTKSDTTVDEVKMAVSAICKLRRLTRNVKEVLTQHTCLFVCGCGSLFASVCPLFTCLFFFVVAGLCLRLSVSARLRICHFASVPP